MEMYRKSSHTVYDVKYHIVWITKYRKPVLVGLVAERCRELIRQVCRELEVEIIKGHVSKDHIHLFVSVAPNISVSKLLQMLKGRSSRKLLQEDRNLQKQYWGQHLWARGYFVASSGNIMDEIIKEYIENQDIEKDNDFRIGAISY
jgi:putative transposase